MAIDLRGQKRLTWREFHQNYFSISINFPFRHLLVHMRDGYIQQGVVGKMVAALALHFSRAKFEDAKPDQSAPFLFQLTSFFFLLCEFLKHLISISCLEFH